MSISYELIKLRSEKAVAFVVALITAAIVSGTTHLLYLGQVGGHPVYAGLLVVLSALLFITSLLKYLSKRQILRNVSAIQDQEPFGSRETHEDPENAVRRMGAGVRRPPRPAVKPGVSLGSGLSGQPRLR